MSKRLAWFLVGVSAVCALADTLVDAAFQPLFSEASVAVHGWPLVPAAALGSAVMGALIVTRSPRHPVGWLLSVIGVTASVSLLGEAYAIWVITKGGPGSEGLGYAAGWLSALLGGPFALTGLTLMFLLVPDGRFLAPGWRYVAAAAAAGYVTFSLGLVGAAPEQIVGRGDPADLSGVSQFAITLGASTIAASLLAAVVSMLLRLRRASGDSRQQLRWIVASAASVGVGLLVLLLGQTLNGGKQTWSTSLPLFVAYFLLPLCIAVAVLRYRLYDIDLIINRAVVLGLATLFVASGYIALVVGVGSFVGGRAERFLPSLVVTAVVAMAFQPLRRRVLRFADRLAYGPRAAPYDALSEFSRQIGLVPAPESLLPAVAEAAGRAVSAISASVRFEATPGKARVAAWPPRLDAAASQRPGTDFDVPVADRTGELGGVTVTLPAGRSLRPRERMLLEDIAEQAALAFRNARLQGELAAQVEALDLRTDQLAASRRRLIEAGDAERRRLEAAISRDVLPTLTSLHADLQDARPARGGSRPTGLLVKDATDALESLRDLTRGIFPTMLTRAGLGPSLSSYFARLGRPGALEMDESATGQRFAPRVEAAAYFCCTESVRNAEGEARVRVAVVGSYLEVDVQGTLPAATDLQAMVDRVEASGGSVATGSGTPGGAGAWLRVRLPIEPTPA